jgi:hydroxypyruvate isomerase
VAIRFSANVNLLFNEHAFLDRFAAAADAGFGGVETLFAYDWPVEAQAERLERFGLQQTLLNVAPGQWTAGDRGLACQPDRRKDFHAGLDTAIAYARRLGCPRLHCVAGLKPDGLARADAEACFIDNVLLAARQGAEYGICVQIEPINQHDMPGFFLSDFGYALELIERMVEAGGPQPRLQFDIYHCALIHGDVVHWIERCAPWTAYFQIAGVPGRHEPDVGELDLAEVIGAIKACHEEVWVGCEYHPLAETVAGLGWMTRY